MRVPTAIGSPLSQANIWSSGAGRESGLKAHRDGGLGCQHGTGGSAMAIVGDMVQISPE